MSGDARCPIRYERSRLVRFLMQVLWPAFVAAAVTTGLVFSAIDPLALQLVGHPLGGTREGAYTAGFLVFWTLYAGACSMTWWVTRLDAQRAVRRQRRAFAVARDTDTATGREATP